MTITLRLVLEILALGAFGVAAVNVRTTPVNLIALGLFLWLLAMIVTV